MDEFAALQPWGALALLWGTAALADEPTVSITTEYLMTVYLPKEAALSVDPSLSISRDPAGGVGERQGQRKGSRSLSGLDQDNSERRLATPIRCSRNYRNRRPRAGVHEQQRQMRCDKETTDRFRKGEAIKVDDCYLISAPTFETKSEKYSWLNDVQAIGKMVEFKPGKEGHLIYDSFVIR